MTKKKSPQYTFNHDRVLEDLLEYLPPMDEINHNTNDGGGLISYSPSGTCALSFDKLKNVYELRECNFYDEHVHRVKMPKLESCKGMVVLFYAPWCGHCIYFKPEYEKFCNKMKSRPQIAVATVNADENKNLLSNAGELVPGFPTIVFYDRFGKFKSTYEGERSCNGLMEWCGEMTN